MSSRGHKNRKKQKGGHKYTSLRKLKRKGSTVKSALAGLPVHKFDWARDLLPEHLWIGALARDIGLDRFHVAFYEFMDALDAYVPDKKYPIGLLSDFALIPEDRRVDFLSKNGSIVEELFCKPIGRVLAFYPDNPAGWLVSQNWIGRDGHLDPETEMKHLRDLVVKLFSGKDEFSSRVRCVPLGRIIKHGSVSFNKGLEIVNLLPRYPSKCTEDERLRVEASARIMTNAFYQSGGEYSDRNWPKYFWRHNLDLVACNPGVFPVYGSTPLTQADVPRLAEVLEHNVAGALEYIEKLQRQVSCDLYDPARDEVFFGLLSRVVRLYCLIADNTNLWSRDTGGIMLRCLADTAITLAYLARCSDQQMFSRFQEYGEGQEKLLMLHLQDSHPESTTVEGADAASVGKELGGFSVELIDIELGHWAKKDVHKMAKDAGMERIHRLVYSPTSSDIHGTWVSLKHSSLCRCTEPLHRFHRLPSFTVPPAYLNTLIVAQDIYEECLTLCKETLNYPDMDKEIKAIPEPPENKGPDARDHV